MAEGVTKRKPYDANGDNQAGTSDNDPHFKLDPLVITVQPQQNQNESRALMSFDANARGQFIPVSGLDFLLGVSSLQIQQTVELGDLMSSVESENRYIVKVANGDTLYMASEISTALQRCLCGSGRSFVLRIHDNTRQEALILQRRLAGATCCFPCRLQEMKVITPPGDYVGRIEQQWTWAVPFYLVRDANDLVLYVIEGPAVRPCGPIKESTFKIMTGDSLIEIGRLVHCWDRQLVNFVTTINLPDCAAQPKHKGLLLGAAFLLEYTYFERAKTSRCLRCNCL